MKRSIHLLFGNILLLTAMISISRCKSKDHPAGPTITTGKTVELIDQQVDKTGILYIEKPNDSLDGMLMYMPDTAFGESRRFRISYAPITSHELGPDFNPISPLITISCGGGFSDSIVTIEIPVHLPPGQFAMGFLYDDRTGKLEGMPILKLEKDRVVVALRNFSHSLAMKGSPIAAQVAGGETEPVTRFVMSAIDEKKLQHDKYDSGFRPGVDDCPSTNWGSTLAPKGHCSGQSQLAMWYYENKKKNGSPDLYSFLEADGGPPTPKFWQDDTKAIRLSSLLQNADENSIVLTELGGFFALGGILASDLLTLYAFSYAIRLTHEPQFIAIQEDWRSREGHAILVYKIEDYVLFIADPNNPGNKTRRIIFNDQLNTFLSYKASPNAGAPGRDYKAFTYIGTTALISSSVVEKFWKSMEDGKLGEDKFPAYTIKVYNKKEFVPFEDGFTTEEYGDALSFSVECSLPTNIYAYEGMEALPLLTPNSGKKVPGEWKYITECSFKVPPGAHRIGLYVSDAGNNGWIGFKWANVKISKKEEYKRPASDIKPEHTAHQELIIHAKINGISIELEDCDFSIGGNIFVLGGTKATSRHMINFRTDSWHGEGEYNDVTCSWASSLDNEPFGTYVNKKDGKMTISKWGEGKLEGVFSFEAYDDYYKKTVTVSGFFAYLVPWLK